MRRRAGGGRAPAGGARAGTAFRTGGTTARERGRRPRGRYGTPAAGTPFSPAEIAGLRLWMRADALGGLVDGDPVETWADGSGNGNDATQATAAKRPVYRASAANGRPAVRFDGVDDYLATGGSIGIGGNPALTLALALAPASAGAQNGVCGWGTSSIGLAAFGLYLSATFGGGGTGRLSTVYAGANNGNFGSYGTALQVVVTTKSPGAIDATSRLFRNGGEQALQAGSSSGTPDIQSPLTVSLGRFADNNADFYGGDLAELLVYDSVLSSADRQRVEQYLAGKYGVPLS